MGDLTPASAGEDLSNESRCDTSDSSVGNHLHFSPMLSTALLLSDNDMTAKHSDTISHYPFTVLGELQYI